MDAFEKGVAIIRENIKSRRSGAALKRRCATMPLHARNAEEMLKEAVYYDEQAEALEAVLARLPADA